MKQKPNRLFSRAAMVLLMMMLTATTAWAEITGSGTQQAPYIIHNAGDWNTAGQDMKYYYNDGTHVYVELADDIDFSGTTFRRFGQDPHYTTPGSCYIHFDGKGHTIRNISMNQGSNNFAAPFGNLVTGSTVSNLTVASSSFTADKWVAGITCKNLGTITNCHVESTVTLTANNIYSEYCGGIAAQNGGTNIGTITNCTVGAKFVLRNGVNQQYYGGIVGYNYGASPVSGCLCYSTDVTSNLDFFKILIGRSYNNGDVVINNYYRPVGNYGHGAPEATTTHVRAVSGIPSGVTSPQLCVSHGGYGYFAANTTITLTAPAHMIFTNDFSASGTGSGYTLSGDKTTATVNIATSDVTVNATVIFGPDFIENSDGSYTIKNANGWSVFCDLLEENAKGYFDGKTVTLDNSIGVTRMAGTSSNPFTGTFNGNKKTLTVNYSGASYVAPFRYVDGATIQNLVVEGTISSSGSRAAGVIGETGSTGTTATSHITNCVSSSTISGDRYTGGFSIGGNVEIEGCVFNGKINGSSLSGGFVGYSNSTLKIKNSLFAPQSGSSISGGTFYYNGEAGTLTNSYYTEALGTAQGTAPCSVTAGDQYVTTCTVSPIGSSTDTYNLSGITAYNDGITRDGTFYYGNGNQVSLTLAHSDRNGYTFSGYAPSAGTLDGATLTMPNANVTIGCTWTANQYAVTLDGQSATTAGTTKVTATYDAAMPAITVPTRTGYTFGGYYTETNGGGTQYYNDNGTSANNWNIAAATMLYAKWTINEYTISFNTNGGTPATINAITQDYNTSITAPTNPTREGYTFAGWNPALPTTMPAGDMTVTAQWTPIVYNITYELDGGSADNPTSFTIETPDFTLTNPTKPGYTFTGWTGTGLTEITTTVVIKQGSTTGRTYTAHYEFAQITKGALSFVCTSATEAKVTACNSGATAVTIPATVSNNDGTYTVTAIEATAFSGCTNLLVVILESDTPPTLGSNAFSACTALNTIGVHSDAVEEYKATDGWLAYKDKIRGYDGTCGTAVLYSYDSTSNTLNIFGTGAMANYNGTNMPWYSDCEDITTVVIENGVTTIGNNAFNGCYGLTSIEIPASVTTIGNNAFNACSGLPSIEIPASVTSIGDDAFRDCTDLTSVIIYAHSLKTYGWMAFDNNASGRKIYVLSNCVNTYKAQASRMGVNEDDIQPIDACGTNVYYSYDSTTKTLRLFGTGAMANYNGNDAPWNSYRENITSVIIGHGVTGIGNSAFSGCSCLLAVILESATPPTLGSGTFDGCTALNSIGVPAGTVGTYKVADGWKDYAEKIYTIDGSCGDNVYYAYNSTTNTLNIFGAGAMTNYNGWFSWNSYREDITTVVINRGVMSIGYNAFKGCTSLISIEIPASVTSIEYCAFYQCTGLTSIEIPASVTSIENYAFYQCTGLTSIEIPANVTSIGDYAFYQCTGLTSIEIPASVTDIGECAFGYCTNLLTVILDPTTPPTLGSDAFDACSALNAIGVPSDAVEAYKAADGWLAYKDKIQGYDGTCGPAVLYSYDSNTKTLRIFGTGAMGDFGLAEAPWSNFSEDITTVIIDQGVTSIGEAAFSYCSSLTSVEIPASLMTIGNYAFYYCTGLTNITIPASLTTIGDYAFEGCEVLTSVTIPSGVTTIGVGAFTSCFSLASIEIPASVTSIGLDAFYHCTSLESISVADGNTTYRSEGNCLIETAIQKVIRGCKNSVIPNDVTRIGGGAFERCVGLNSIEIPASVTDIGNGAFKECPSLVTVFMGSATPPTLGSEVFNGCTALNTIVVPSGTAETYKAAEYWSDYKEKIYAIDGTCGTGVYYTYNSTTKTLNIFGTGAMSDYNSTNMPWYSNRTNITTVIIGDGVTHIGTNAFNGCTLLINVFIESATPATLGSGAFDECTALNAIYVPSGTVTAYKAADDWKDYADKIQGNDGTCGTNVYYSYDSTTKTLTIFGTGAMEDYDGTNMPWYSYREDITTVVIENDVTNIGDFAFRYCTSLGSITIPASVTNIGDYVFQYCTSLTSIEIPASVTSIGYYALDCCSSLESISVADRNPVYDSRNDCNAIIETNTNTLLYGCKNTVIPGGSDGVTTIGQHAFSNCTSLTSIEIPDGVTSIGEFAFAGCTSLESIEIPASVTTIGDAAFANCTGLSTVTIYAPELGEYDGFYAFDGNAEDRKIYVFKNCMDTYKAQASLMSANADDIEAITGINLRDNDDNSSLIAAAAGNALGALDVTLKGRTLYKDGKWNTLCLPFNVVLEGSPLEGATARPLKAASITGTTLNLTFGDAVSTLVAGTPYIIKWAGGDDIVNPVFEGVTIDATDPSFTSGDTQVSFLGTYKSTTYTDEDKSILFLGADNTLYYPQSGATIGACRAYFKIVEDDAPQPVRKLMSFRLVFGNDETLSGSFAASIQRGDANADGNVSVTDIAVVVNCILQLDNTGGFSDYGADANGDGQVTVTDIGVIVDKILGSPSPTPPEGGEPQ